jgi:hypothetical protein
MSWLADDPASNAQAGPLGLLVVVLLAIATVVLIRSMTRHLRRVPVSFDPEAAAAAGEAEAATAAGDADSVSDRTAEVASDGAGAAGGEPAEAERPGDQGAPAGR